MDIETTKSCLRDTSNVAGVVPCSPVESFTFAPEGSDSTTMTSLVPRTIVPQPVSSIDAISSAEYEMVLSLIMGLGNL